MSSRSLSFLEKQTADQCPNRSEEEPWIFVNDPDSGSLPGKETSFPPDPGFDLSMSIHHFALLRAYHERIPVSQGPQNKPLLENGPLPKNQTPGTEDPDPAFLFLAQDPLSPEKTASPAFQNQAFSKSPVMDDKSKGKGHAKAGPAYQTSPGQFFHLHDRLSPRIPEDKTGRMKVRGRHLKKEFVHHSLLYPVP